MQGQSTNPNFRLIQADKISEIHTEVFIYEHLKSGAQLMHMPADDPNKVFCVTFKTPPEDNTGCPHILEHSVLNGSKNFPSKDTFTELMKGSMKTFLNAFTASDKTMYPIASTNEKDFYNLMQVYMDAVFYPNMQTKEEILKQEGWHYELFNPEDEIVYKGVVYNEMKGAFSSPESVLMRFVEQVQFPDTPYHFESGGDPIYIPELTWDRFKAFHSKFYHPSNSRIFLYGDMDIEQCLSFIDQKYLHDFDKLEIDNQIPLQTPFASAQTVEKPYPISVDDEIEGKNYISFNYTYGSVLDVNTASSFSTLKQILLDSPASPLKQAIQDSNLAADSFGYMNDGCLQPTLSIICKHVRTEDIPALQNLVENELKRLSEQGLDKKLIEATINSKEFYLREADMSHFPKGLYYNMAALNTWLHSGDPTLYLKFEPMLEYLRTGLHEPLFENLIKQGMLENPHSSLIILKPEAGLNEQKDAVVTKFLADYKAALSPEQIQALIAENNALLAWQSQPDDPADIEKIPCISKADISPSAPDRGSETETIDGITWLKHSTFTNGIAYLHAAFEINHIALEDLPWLSLLVDMVGNLNTTNYSYAELNNEIDIHTGGVYIDLSLNNDNRDFSNILPKVMLSSKCVLSKLEQTLELMAEYGFNTVFSDTNRISQLLKESKSRIQMMIISSGHLIAIRKLVGQFSQLQALNDATEGMGYYSFLCEVESQLEINPEVVVNKLSLLSKQIFKRNNLLLSITAEKSVIPMIQSAMQSFIAKIPTPDVHPVDWQIILNKSNLGIYAPINVQYCAQGGNFVKHGYQYSGKMMVLANILRNDFLMQELRVKGGAYGIMLGFVRNGNMYFCSYRDPNLSETLDVYDQVADFVEGFTCSQRDLDKYIIGTMAELEMPKTPRQTGWESLSDYITGLTQADHQKIRTEVLSTTLEDIRAYAPLIRKVMTDRQFCVFGSENKVKANSELFDAVVAAIS